MLDISVCRDALKKTYSDRGGMELLKGIIEGAEPENPGNPGPSSSLPWCRCGRCRAMPLEIENVCCRKRPYVTAQDFFQSAVLDMLQEKTLCDSPRFFPVSSPGYERSFDFYSEPE